MRRARTTAIALAIVVAWAFGKPATALADDAAEARALAAYDRFESYALLDWHPRRREVLVSRRSGDTTQVSVVREPGAAPVALTDLAGGASAARYAPGEGRYFVFIGAESAHGAERLYRRDAATGALDALSPDGERVVGFAWSPAGDRLVYATREAARRPAKTTLHLVDPARPAADRVLARLEGDNWTDLRFSPDSRRLVLRERVSPADSRLWVVDVANGRRRRVTPVDRGAPVRYGAAAFTADARALITTSQRGSGWRRLVELPLAAGREKVLTAKIAHDVERFAVSLEAKRIAFTTNEDGTDVLRFLDLGTLRELPRPPLVAGVIGALRWRPHSQEIGFTMSSARSAGDVFSYDLESNKLARWTNGNSPEVNTAAFAEPHPIAWKTADGRRLTGLLYLPPARFAGPRPVLVRVHASGHAARPSFIGRDNYLVNELGIALLYPNLGRPGPDADEGDAMRDLGALIDWIGAHPGLDPSRVAIAAAADGGLPALGLASRLGDHPVKRVFGANAAHTSPDAAGSVAVWLLVGAGDRPGDASAFAATLAFARRTLLAPAAR